MAPKKPNPMEEPPAASSSEEEDETSSAEEEAEAEADAEAEAEAEEEVEDGSSEEEEEEEGDDDEEDEEPANLKTPPPQQASRQTKKAETISAPSDDSGTESESESDPDSTPKPIATKPMEETSKSAKPRSKQIVKRPNEADENEKESKRAKKKGSEANPTEEDTKKPGEDTKKVLFQRLWSEDDEIAVLKGLIDYSTKKGNDPNDMNAFHDSIKKSLHVDVTRAQLMDKIRRLKKKYENKLKGAKKGEDRTFTKPHEKKAYDLSKKLWGSEGNSGIIDTSAKSNGKARKIQTPKANTKASASLKAELHDGGKVEKMVIDNDKDFNLKSCGVAKEELPPVNKAFGLAGIEDYVLGKGFELIQGPKKEELEDRWNKMRISELELFAERADLVKEQTTLILEALRQKDN